MLGAKGYLALLFELRASSEKARQAEFTISALS